MTAATKVLAIGLDAAEQSLIRRWMAAGDLPALAALRERSVWGALGNEPGLYTGAVWPSIITGTSAGRHGRYYYRQLRPGSYRTYHFRPEDLAGQPFWQALGAAGRRVAVIDVPKSPLTKELNGIQIVDWGTHDPDIPQASSWPQVIAREAIGRFGSDPVGQCDFAGRDAAAYRELRDRLIDRVERKRALVEHYLARGGWDLFLACFSDSHCAGHQLWHLYDAGAEGPEGGALSGLLKEVYVALDAALGRLLERVGEETPVLVFSSHGFGTHYDATSLLDEILRRLEETAAPPARRLLLPIRDAYRALLPVDLRTRLRPLAAKAFDLTDSYDDIARARERARRRVFALPSNDNCGLLRVNLVGREPEGRVRPGPEFEDLHRALSDDLMAIENRETGGPVVKEVLRTSEHVTGERVDTLPDFIVRFHREAPIRRIGSPKIGEIVRQDATGRTGDHRPEGLFLARAPGLAPRELARPVSSMDLAPTLARWLGVTLAEVDGAAVAELVAEGVSA